jgi:hypothetical protein
VKKTKKKKKTILMTGANYNLSLAAELKATNAFSEGIAQKTL